MNRITGIFSAGDLQAHQMLTLQQGSMPDLDFILPQVSPEIQKTSSCVLCRLKHATFEFDIHRQTPKVQLFVFKFNLSQLPLFSLQQYLHILKGFPGYNHAWECFPWYFSLKLPACGTGTINIKRYPKLSVNLSVVICCSLCYT